MGGRGGGTLLGHQLNKMNKREKKASVKYQVQIQDLKGENGDG